MALRDYIPGSVRELAVNATAGARDYWEANFTLNAERDQHAQHLSEEAELFGLIETSIANATQIAHTRGGEHESVTLLDYYEAANDVLNTVNEQRTAQGLRPYNIQQLSDMRAYEDANGQVHRHNLENFQFSNSHDVPGQNHLDQVNERYGITTLDDDQHGLSEEERGYSIKSVGFRLSGAILSNATFIPASTFHDLGIDDTGDITINGAIFQGMHSSQTLHLAAGTYNDISVTHVNPPNGLDGRTDRTGAIIQLDSGAHIDGLDVSGQTLSFVLAPRCSLKGVNTENASVLRFDAEGASVQDARFLGSTFAMNSTMTGMQWTSATFEDVNIQSVDLSNNRFTNCGFVFGENSTDEPLRDVNLTGARMDGVTLTETHDEGTRRPLTFADLERLGVNPGEMPSINGQTYQQYMVQMMHEEILQQAKTIAAPERAYAPGSPQEAIENIRNLFTGEKSGLILAAAEADTVMSQVVPQTNAAKTAIADRNAGWAASAGVINMANNNNGE